MQQYPILIKTKNKQTYLTLIVDFLTSNLLFLSYLFVKIKNELYLHRAHS